MDVPLLPWHLKVRIICLRPWRASGVDYPVIFHSTGLTHQNVKKPRYHKMFPTLVQFSMAPKKLAGSPSTTLRIQN